MSGAKTTWAKVEKGAVVELNGRPYLVEKIKRDGKRATIRISHKGRSSKGVVRLKDPVVTLATGGIVTSKRGPVLDAAGTMQRWATEKERAAMLGPGDPTQIEPPSEPDGGLWDTPATKVERKLDKILGARLVGVSTDEDAGYYVPPVDITTVAAHLAIFHGGIPDACDGEAQMLAAHDAQHAAAKTGEGVLAVVHWHVEKRPEEDA